MKLEYYKTWFSYKREPRSPLTEEEAKKVHEGKKPYVVLVKQDEKIKYVIKMNFNLYYCGVLYLGQNPENIESDGYIEVDSGLFLRERRTRVDGQLIGYLYEVNGVYRKDIFGKTGKLLQTSEHTKDVSDHFCSMVEFGNYHSILPQIK